MRVKDIREARAFLRNLQSETHERVHDLERGEFLVTTDRGLDLAEWNELKELVAHFGFPCILTAPAYGFGIKVYDRNRETLLWFDEHQLPPTRAPAPSWVFVFL